MVMHSIAMSLRRLRVPAPGLCLMLLAAVALVPALAQERVSPEDQEAVVRSLASTLEERYVFPDVAREMADRLRKNLKAGHYRDLDGPPAFADRLTQDIQAVSHDKHLNVRFNPEMAATLRQAGDDRPDGPSPEMIERGRRENFGFREARILDGNVGYLDLRGFMPPAIAGDAATAAMNFLSGADAIIFDLRRNGGGHPGMIQLLTSYLYGSGANVHLNSFYDRPSDETSQTWTLPYVPGKRNPDALVYVLTSNYTFSAAEEFTYNLKNLKRGTIVGETTGGGAHPGSSVLLAGSFVAFIPTGRAINPITGTNWEGTGVTPDVAVASGEALAKAHLLALQELQQRAATDEAKRFYGWHLVSLQAQLEPVNVPAAVLESYAGTYGLRSLTFENGRLYYQRTGRPKAELQALTADTFAPVGMPGLRLTVEMDAGRPVALVIRQDNGMQERMERSAPR
jgi:hypothetical protein